MTFSQFCLNNQKRLSMIVLKAKPTLLLFINLLFISLLVLLTPPQTQADGPPPDYACKSCHINGVEKDPLTLPSGEKIILNLQANELEASVHGSHLTEDIGCTDCHQNRQQYRYPHQPNPAQSLQEFAADIAPACQTCHDSLQEHNPGHLFSNNPNVPTCTNCHSGGHAITPANSLGQDMTATCQTCHQDYTSSEQEAMHKAVMANLGEGETCQTCHTDTWADKPEQDCETCHSLLDTDLILESGESIPLQVEPETILNSMHGANFNGHSPFQCTDCHSNKETYTFPHQNILPDDKRSFVAKRSAICEDCHTAVSEKHGDSTHAQARAEGNLDAATCIDCHGAHDVQKAGEPIEAISQTCGQCHAEINEQYEQSVHGEALLGTKDPDSPLCIDCHGVHDITDPSTTQYRLDSPLLCATCHADEELMGQYGLSHHVLETYVADFHGTTVELFEDNPDNPPRQAVCFDCHGVHDIKRIDDPVAGLAISENLDKTCQKCHEEATPNFPQAWLGHYEPSPDEFSLVYYTEWFFIILTTSVLMGLVSHISLDFMRLILKKLGR